MRLRYKVLRTIGLMRAMSTPMAFPLLDLPNELISLVIENIDSPMLVQRLACTCHRVQQLAEPVLYRDLLLRSGLKVIRVLDALKTRNERSSAIQRLDIPCDQSYEHSFIAIEELLMRLPNLREFVFESPACNTGDFEDDHAWTRMTTRLLAPFRSTQMPLGDASLTSLPLQKLQRCEYLLYITFSAALPPKSNAQTLRVFYFEDPRLCLRSC